MKFGIVISKKDKAGMCIASGLDKLGLKYVLVEKETIYEDDVDKRDELKDIDFIIFATKHESEKETKTLSVHAPGNWKDAQYGGVPGKICKTSALFMKHIFGILSKEVDVSGIDYSVSMEATHHGPLIDKPCCFIEVGSTLNQWNDVVAGKVIAKVIQEAISKDVNENFESVIGIGGPHYCPNFNKIQLNTGYAVAHIIAQYAFPVSHEMIEEALGKTEEDVKKVLIDWKGCGVSSERQKIIDFISEMGLEVLRSDEIGK